MIPQILQQLGGGLKLPPQVKQMISLVRSAGNPQLMMNQIMQSSPAMKQVMDIVNRYGGDANKAFYEMAKENGIDPQEIINLLK